MIDLLISIVTYNNEKIIKETIESIINQTQGISYKIFIYDNNSLDKTIDIIKSINACNIEIIEGKINLGFGYGHNQIINREKAKYYLIYNPDLHIKSNILKELFDFMEANIDTGMITPKIVYPDGQLQYLCKQNPTVFDLFIRRFVPGCLQTLVQARIDKYEMRNTGYNKIFSIPYATGCFMLFRGDILKRLNGFDENFFMYLEDADITRRTNMISKSVFYPFDSVEHLWARGSHNSLRLTLVTLKSAIYYFSKWGWKFI